MRRPGFLIALLLLAGPAAAQDLQSYSPSKPATAPKLINAEVTKADTQTGLVTFRSESGDVLVTAGREVTAGMALKPGDKVMIAFRDVKDASGFPSRMVTEVRLASPAAAAPAARASVSASAPKKSKVEAARVQASGAPATATTGAAQGTAQGQASNAGTAQAGGAATGAATPATGAVTTTGGGAVATGAGTSPYTNPVPSVNSAAPVVTAVLPPAGAKAPLSETEVGTMRAQGLRDLDASAVALAAVANDIDTAWFRFKNQCLKGAAAATSASSGREWFAIADVPAPADDNDTCRTMRTELTARVKGFQDQLGIVEDAARKADLLPAQVREVLDRHRLIR
jgi:hypothetical protein